MKIRDRIKELRRVPADQLQPNPKNWRTEEEADKLLATFDPLGAMAEADANKLREVLESVETANHELSEMLAALAEEHGIVPPDFEPASIDDQGQLDQKAPITCPHCNREFVPK